MLSFSEKLAIRLRTGWSDRVLSSIGSLEEAGIYIRAGLRDVNLTYFCIINYQV